MTKRNIRQQIAYQDKIIKDNVKSKMRFRKRSDKLFQNKRDRPTMFGHRKGK
jgi:hypothetical protein